MGLAIDTVQQEQIGAGQFWPIGVIGVIAGLAFLVTALNPSEVAAETEVQPSR
jgi:hypothetical protein